MNAFQLACDLWTVAGVVWAIGMTRGKRNVQKQSRGSRVAHIGLFVIVVVLLFLPRVPLGLLDQSIAPRLPLTGLELTVAGIAIAVWARLLLGQNWSATVTIKQDHQLIRRGPYALVRHPIYSGFLLALFGTALISGQLRGFLAVALALFGWWRKSRMEEQFMIQQFDGAYLEYQREVKALIPFLI